MRIKAPFKKSNLFFTSDQHFGHKNINDFCDRGFIDVDEMNQTLLSQWNDTVPEDGIVFCAGDLFFRTGSPLIKYVMENLNGEIYWIKGNHDHSRVMMKNKMPLIDRYEILVEDEDADSNSPFENAQYVVIDHYPMVSWNHMHKGAFHFFGHTHGNYEHEHPRALDIGVDGDTRDDFRPISYDECKKAIYKNLIL